MYFSGMDLIISIFMIIFMILYIFSFYTIILKRDSQRSFLRKFYNAICNIFEQAEQAERAEQAELDMLDVLDAFTYVKDSNCLTYWFEQLNLNFEKLCQSMPNNNYTSILDLLETIMYYYDSYSDNSFGNIFRQEKKAEIRNFIAEMIRYIKNMNPFISIPKKESDLMQSIVSALKNNNISLGLNSLNQLSQEIATKEKMLVKKEKENQRASIVSIVGIILTIFFGFLSIFPIWPK